jgi:hypothetical protein
MKKTILFLTILLVQAVSIIASGVSEDAVLLNGYMKYLLSVQVQQQVDLVSQNALEKDRKQIGDITALWFSGRMEGIKNDLVGKCGENAQDKFMAFMSTYESAEKKGNKEYLGRLVDSVGIASVPADYPSFKKSYLDGNLKGDIDAASSWLSEIQTWADLRCKTNGVPDLNAWVSRNSSKVGKDVPAGRESVKTVNKKPAKSAADSLENAEADVGAIEVPEEEAGSPMDAFSEMRNKRREKALEEAQAGMQQVAQERQAAEQEYAAKKTAAAQAEAENLKNHADKIAAAEKDAMDQRANSWSARLKSIVGATISAATGAFTGGLGATAGQMAVNAVFGDGHHGPVNPMPPPYYGPGSSAGGNPSQQ